MVNCHAQTIIKIVLAIVALYFGTAFFLIWPLAMYCFFNAFYWMSSSQVFTLAEKEENPWRKLTLGAVLIFLLTYSLHNRLLDSSCYIAYAISAKNCDTTRWTITGSQLVMFSFSDPIWLFRPGNRLLDLAKSIRFCVAYTRCNSHLVIIRDIYSFIYCIQGLSPCHMIHGEDWVLVSGCVGDFARGEDSFNFIPCF